MTGNKNEYEAMLIRLADALVDDMMELTDEEIMAEAAEEYGDPLRAADEAQGIIDRAFVLAGKERLRSANAGVRFKKAPKLKVMSFAKQDKVAIIRKVIVEARRGKMCLTLAARKEEELADANLDAKLEGLVELGVIDEGGELRLWHRDYYQPGEVNESNTPAVDLLEELGVTEPDELHRLEAIAKHQGVTVHYRPLVGCAAHIVGVGERAIAFINKGSTAPRQRFSLAHELGHWQFHRGQILTCQTDGKLGSDTDGNDAIIERSADAYAANLLLPEYLFGPRLRGLGTTIEAAEKLSNEFKTSFTATLIRLVELGPEPAIVVCHGSKGRKWYVRGPGVSNKWVPRGDLHPRSRAWVMLGERRKNAPLWARADMWLEHRDASSFEVIEQSKCVGNEVLTLLVSSNLGSTS